METHILTASDGIPLQYYHWPVAQAKAVLLLLHGLGGHAAKYEDVAQFFNGQQVAMAALDLRGHGQSGGKRGHLPDYDQVMQDLWTFFNAIREQYSTEPLFLFGHSYGGNLALNFALRQQPPVAGLILSSAWMRLAIDSRSIKALAKEIYYKLSPVEQPTKKPQASLITHDEEKHRQYVQDPLIHSEATPSLLFHATKAAEWALQNAHELTVPTLIMHGTDDPITNYKSSVQLAETMGSNAQLKLWEHKLHELLHEKGRQEIWEYLMDWMNEQLRA